VCKLFAVSEFNIFMTLRGKQNRTPNNVIYKMKCLKAGLQTAQWFL